MDYKKKDENLDYLNKKPKKNESYKTIIVAGIIIMIIFIIWLVRLFI